MNLELVRRPASKRVSPQSVLDYETFARRYPEPQDIRGLKLFEKFVIASKLIREGYDTYIDPILKLGHNATLKADAGGIKENEILVAFCSISEPDEKLWNTVQQVSQSENGRVLIVYAQEVDDETIPENIDRSKIEVEALGWFDD